MKKQVTIKDVAACAHTSVGSVSNMLNGKPGSPEICERIRAAIRKLHYVQNMHARAVRTSRTKCIGLLVNTATADDYPWIQSEISEFIATTEGSGYHAMLEYWDPSSGRLPQLLNNVDGLLLRGAFGEDFFEMVHVNGNIPVIWESDNAKMRGIVNIKVKYEPGMREVLSHLLELGHRRIGYVGMGPKGPFGEKAQAYEKVWHELGLEGEPLIEDAFLFSGNPARRGYFAVKKMFRRAPDITAVFFDSDCYALGGMNALYDLHLRIPSDCSVIAMDGTDWSLRTYPSVTALVPEEPRMPQEVRTLLSMIANPEKEREIHVNYRLEIRETTAKKKR